MSPCLNSLILLSLHLEYLRLGYFLRLFTFAETTLQDIVEFIRQQNQAFMNSSCIFIFCN